MMDQKESVETIFFNDSGRGNGSTLFFIDNGSVKGFDCKIIGLHNTSGIIKMKHDLNFE